jgi:hypothetical protein
MGFWALRLFNIVLENELQNKVKDDPKNAQPKHF